MGSNLTKLAGVDFGIQLLAFIPSVLFKTEKFFDFTGSLTFITLARLSLQKSQKTLHQRIQTNLVTAWAVRLGCFLLYRVLRDSGDKRFNRILGHPSILFQMWALQGVWVITTLLPTLINNENERDSKLTKRDYIGWGLWAAGFLIEVIADYQKLKFRGNPENDGKFISHGLWSISRHPNYFGEILLWLGLFISASSSFKGWQWASAISPIYVYYLLNKVSGIPMLERMGLKRYGHLPEYHRYLKYVPELTPFIGLP